LIYEDDLPEDVSPLLEGLIVRNRYFKNQEYRERAYGLRRLTGQIRERQRKLRAAHKPLTPAEYATRFKVQKGLCAICGKPESARNKCLAGDHNARTGKHRALLCTRCNIGLGYFLESPEALRAAAAYIEHWR
jgi:hypothetical protein